MTLFAMGVHVSALVLLGLSMFYDPLCSMGVGIALIGLLVARASSCHPAKGSPTALLFLLGLLWSTGMRLFEVGNDSPWPSCLAVPLLSSLAISIPLTMRLAPKTVNLFTSGAELTPLMTGCLLGCWIAGLIGVDSDKVLGQLWGMIFLTAAVVAATIFLLAGKGAGQVDDRDDDEPLPGPFLPCAGLSVLEGYDLLTARERAVLHLSLAGKDVRAIAAELEVAPSTVSTYRARCCEKLGVGTLQDVVQRVALSLTQPAKELGESLKPRGAGYLVSSLILLLLCLGSRAMPALAGKQFVTGTGFVLVGLFALLRAEATYAHGTPVVDKPEASSLFDGVAMGLVFAEAAYCTITYLVPYSMATFLLVAAVLFAEAKEGRSAKRSDLFCGSMVGALVLISSSGLLLQLGKTPLAALLLAAAIALLAAAVRRTEESDARAEASDIVLLGQGRALAYLQGRGLSELQSKTAFLTALGLDLTHIADSLCISRATVSSYRTKAYRALGVHDKAALTELLTRECGFRSPEDMDGGPEQ